MENCNETEMNHMIVDDYTLNHSDLSFQPDLEAGTNFSTTVTSFETHVDSNGNSNFDNTESHNGPMI